MVDQQERSAKTYTLLCPANRANAYIVAFQIEALVTSAPQKTLSAFLVMVYDRLDVRINFHMRTLVLEGLVFTLKSPKN